MSVLWTFALALLLATFIIGRHRGGEVIWLGFWAGLALMGALWYTVAHWHPAAVG